MSERAVVAGRARLVAGLRELAFYARTLERGGGWHLACGMLHELREGGPVSLFSKEDVDVGAAWAVAAHFACLGFPDAIDVLAARASERGIPDWRPFSGCPGSGALDWAWDGARSFFGEDVRALLPGSCLDCAVPCRGLSPRSAVRLVSEPALRAWLAAWVDSESEFASRVSGGGALSALYLVLRDFAGKVLDPLLDPEGWPSFAPFPSGPCVRFPVLAEALSDLSGSVPLRARVLRELLVFSARVLASADASARFAQGNYSRDALRVKWVQRAFNVLWQRAHAAGSGDVVDLADLPVLSREVDGFLHSLDFFGGGR